jgi:hypothetical protein
MSSVASGASFSLQANFSSPRATSRPRLKLAPRVALAAAFFAVLFIFTPPADPHFRVCGFYWLTGHPCALCGMTRAMFALAKGHFAEAIHFNALAPLGFAMVFALFWSWKIPGWVWSASMVAFALYGICRFFVTQ